MMRPPLDRTHDISQTGYHIKDLRTFGESLTNAAAGAFPKGKSRYKEVHVLLLSWEDDKLGVMKEIDELGSVFDQVSIYGFSRHRGSLLKRGKRPTITISKCGKFQANGLIIRWSGD